MWTSIGGSLVVGLGGSLGGRVTPHRVTHPVLFVVPGVCFHGIFFVVGAVLGFVGFGWGRVILCGNVLGRDGFGGRGFGPRIGPYVLTPVKGMFGGLVTNEVDLPSTGIPTLSAAFLLAFLPFGEIGGGEFDDSVCIDTFWFEASFCFPADGCDFVGVVRFRSAAEVNLRCVDDKIKRSKIS